MMQSELLIQPSWPYHTYFDTNLDDYENDEYLSSINSTPENSFISSEMSYGYPSLGYDQIQQQSSSSDTHDSSHNMMVLDDVSRWLCDEDQKLDEIQMSEELLSEEELLSPMEEMSEVLEPESQTGLKSLLNAYAEAMEMGQTELAKVLVSCISEKTNLVGPAFERVAFNLFRSPEDQEEYLNQESLKNLKSAFRAFYEIFPYGRFAHFTANSAILEAIPTHVKSLDIIDFDLREGSQWPVIIEAISKQRKSLTITSIKHEDHDSQLENTKRNLCTFARAFGLTLKVQEIEMGQIVNITYGKDFVVFNCMTSLPHMRKTRKTTQVMDFLKIASSYLAKNKGIITFGEGEVVKKSSTYTSFFDDHFTHYKALYESMEWGFPSYLNEARMAMETLFVAPFVSSQSWFQKWDEGRKNTTNPSSIGLKGRSMSIESLNEARELVKEGESPYGIRIEGENGNEMTLEWNAIPLVKVSVWM